MQPSKDVEPRPDTLDPSKSVFITLSTNIERGDCPGNSSTVAPEIFAGKQIGSNSAEQASASGFRPTQHFS